MSEDLPTQALERYLAAHVPGDWRDLTLRRYLGGQSNPTFLVKGRGNEAVLRTQPAGHLLPSAHAIDREFRVMRALAGSGVPVPRMLHYCTDASIIGTPFYVMEHVRGRVHKDALLEGEPPETRATLYDAMNETLARLHSVDYAARNLGDYGRPGNYFAR